MAVFTLTHIMGWCVCVFFTNCLKTTLHGFNPKVKIIFIDFPQKSKSLLSAGLRVCNMA